MEEFLNKGLVWIINPYGSLPSESWATYRSTMLAETLACNGFKVRQFISNFEHRSKTFRSEGYKEILVNDSYSISIIASKSYGKHMSIARIQYERAFAKNLLLTIKPMGFPDFIILAEPSLFYYNILLRPLIVKSKSILILDIIDIWPELFELAIPKRLRVLSGLILAPFYYWRKRLYKYPQAIVAVANDYLRIAKETAMNEKITYEVVYWSFHQSNDKPILNKESQLASFVKKKQPNEVWAIYAGTLGENYDIFSIVHAAHSLSKEMGNQNFKIVVAGDGPLKDFCMINESENFVFLGRLGSEDLRLLYRHCDFALSTYKGESTVAMPIKAFDYISNGLPIINSLGRDLGALIEDHELGINYNPDYRDDLVKAIKILISDADLRKRYSKNALSLAPEFESKNQYMKFVDVIEKLQDDNIEKA